MLTNRSHLIAKTADTNRIFVNRPDPDPTSEKYNLIVSKIDQEQLEASQRAMNCLLRKERTLLGGDKHKDQFTMRGHLDDLEKIMNEMTSEYSYHLQ